MGVSKSTGFVVVAISLVLLSGCVDQNREVVAQPSYSPGIIEPNFNGFLYSTSAGELFVAASSFHVLQEGKVVLIERGQVLAEDYLKNITGLPTVRPILEKPAVSSQQASAAAEGKLSDIVAAYRARLDEFNTGNCSSDCLAGKYCKETSDSGGVAATGATERAVAPCPTMDPYCSEFCEQRGIAVNRGLNTFSSASLPDPLLLYYQDGSPLEYTLLVVDNESQGTIITVNASSGIVSPSNISAGDYLPMYIRWIYYVHPYSTVLKWDDESWFITPQMASGDVSEYMRNHGIAGSPEQQLYVRYNFK
jgi:hypothetical protein